jgi:hypothetical protein
MLAAEIKKKRIGPPRCFSNWRWHLDEGLCQSKCLQPELAGFRVVG